MKQTNNAIKFLMAQYRAIFKNAYFKGMATALVLTAGLATSANTSQAADNDWYTATGDVSNVTNWAPGTPTGSTNANSGAAGSIDFGTSGSLSDGTIGAGDGIASGGRLDIGSGATTIGSDFEVQKVTSGSAYGGYVNISAGSSTAGAVDNIVTLNNGGGINKSMFGAYVNSTVGSAYASDNAAIINLGANESARIRHSDGKGGLFGASVQTSNGIATATNNRVEINLNSAISGLNLTNGSFGVVGAVAQGNEGIVATGNSVKVNVTDAQTGTRINLSSGGVNSIQGAFALNQTTNAVAPTVTAANNSVTANNISFGTNNGAYIFGGRAMNNEDANAGADLISRDNIVTLSNVDITSTSSDSGADMQLVGNFAQVLVTNAPTTGDNRATAIGNGTDVNLSIDGGALSYISEGNADDSVSNLGSVAAGGIAYTGSGGGSATANLNVASIKNVHATNVNFYGGAAFTTSADAKEQTEASNNTLTIDSVSLDVNSDKGYENNHVAGGIAFLSGTIDDTSAEASSNTLNVTNSSYESSNASTAKTITSNLYGAVVQTSTSGATVTANQNAVSVGNGLRVDGSVYGVQASHNGTFTGNNVSFDATLTGAADSDGVIAGVGIETGTSGADATHLATISLLNNTVTLGTNARVTNTSIVGAQLADNNSKDNDVIHSGNNVIVNGVYIVDDSTSNKKYNLAGDDVQINGTAVIHVKEGTLNISGLSNGADSDPDYFNGTGTVAAGAKIANNGTINVYNALDVQGDNSLIATADKALINVNAGSAAPETNDHDPVTESKATLYITQQGLTNYLTGSDTRTTLYDQVEVGDKAGTLNVTSGGTVDFKTTVTLNDFSFSSANAESAAEAGKIHVSGTASADNYVANFRADTVNLEHALVTDTKTLRADLNNIDTLAFDNTGAIAIQANTLNLGATGLSSTRSESIQFGKATVRDEINFLAATSGNDIKNDGTLVGTNVRNDGYHLTSEVVGSHYMLTNTQDGKLQYYTAQNGVINGTVTIQAGTGDSGALTIQNGNWVAHDQITVASGGTLTVGGAHDIDIPAGVNADGPDATLVLDQALVLDVSAAGDANVNVTGDDTTFNTDYADELDGTVSAPTQRVALLDLRNGLTLERDTTTGVTNGGISGSANITASSGGIVLLNADDVNTILAQNDLANESSGAFFKAQSGGAFVVEGDLFADFGDFSASNNGFNLSGNGTLVSDKLTVQNDVDSTTPANDAEYIADAPTVNFGGSVYVGDLAINDLQLTNGGDDGKDKPADAGNYASQVVVANGDVHVSKSLTSYNQTLVLGANGSSADFTFATDAFGDAGTIAIDNLRVDSGSLSFENGTWTAKAIDLNAENTSLTVGSAIYEDINGADSAATLNVDTLTMSGGSSADIKANGTANIKSADFSELDAAAADATSAVNVAGTLNVTDSVKFGGEGSISIAKNGVLAFGSAATNAAIVKDGTYTSANATVLTSANSGSFTKIRNNGGELHLGLAASTVFGGDQIRQLKADLFTADSFEGENTLAGRVLKNGGVLNIGDATFQGVQVSELVGEGLSGYTATWDNLKSFSDIFGNDVTNNTLVQTNVSGIEPGDNVQGHWGSLSMVSGLAPSAQVEIAGNTSLNYAAGNNGFFISSADHQTALGAIIQSQKDLTLENGGTIGAITMEAGLDDAVKNLTALNVVGPNKTTIASINGQVGANDSVAENTFVNIQGGEAEITGDITAIDMVDVVEGAYLHVLGNADIDYLYTLNSNAKFDQTLTIHDGEILGGTTEALDVVLESYGNVRDGHGFDSLDVANGGLLKADTFTFKNDPTANNGNGALMVGYDLTEADATLEDGTKITGTGYLEITNYLDLNGGTLVVDPAYGEATSVAAVMNFKDGSDTTYETELNDVGIINGTALIGKNAALGIGATLAETQEAIAKYQTNGSLSEDNYGSILYLNGQMTLEQGSEIALNSASTVRTVEGIRDTLKYNLVEGDSENLREDQYADLGLGANTAILMTEQAFISDSDGTKNGVAITFNRTNSVVNGQGGDIVLIGSFLKVSKRVIGNKFSLSATTQY